VVGVVVSFVLEIRICRGAFLVPCTFLDGEAQAFWLVGEETWWGWGDRTKKRGSILERKTHTLGTVGRNKS